MIPWFAGPSPGNSKSVPLSLWVAAWTLLIVGFVLGFALFAPVLPIMCITIVTVVISMASRKQAETQQYAMLALIGAAVKRAMPLETAVAAFGHERGGWMRRRSREMANQLLRGVPLPMAIKEAPGVLPPEAIPLTCVGHDTGALSRGYRPGDRGAQSFRTCVAIDRTENRLCLSSAIAGHLHYYLHRVDDSAKLREDLQGLWHAAAGGDPGADNVMRIRGKLVVSGCPVLAGRRRTATLLHFALCRLDSLGPAGIRLARAAAAYGHAHWTAFLSLPTTKVGG